MGTLARTQRGGCEWCAFCEAMLMRKEIKIGNAWVIMDVCRLCGIGSGVTVYPDGVTFVHTERSLRDGYCRDCWDLAHRRANGNGNQGHEPAATSFSKPPSQ